MWYRRKHTTVDCFLNTGISWRGEFLKWVKQCWQYTKWPILLTTTHLGEFLTIKDLSTCSCYSACLSICHLVWNECCRVLRKCGHQHSLNTSGAADSRKRSKILMVKQDRIQSCLLNCTCSGVEGKESITLGTEQASSGHFLLPVSPILRFHAHDSHVPQDWLISNMLSLPVWKETVRAKQSETPLLQQTENYIS